MNSRRYLCHRTWTYRFTSMACTAVLSLALTAEAAAQTATVYNRTPISSGQYFPAEHIAHSPSYGASYGGQMPQDVQDAFNTAQMGTPSWLDQSASEPHSIAGFSGAGYNPANAWGGYSIGDFFSGRLRSRRALVPVADFQAVFFRSRQFANAGVTTLEPSGYFRQIVGVQTQTGASRYTFGDTVLLPGNDGAIQSGIVQFSNTGATLATTPTAPVQQASGLVAAQDSQRVYGGFFASSTLTVSDSGPFVAETAGEVSGFIDASGSFQQVLVDGTGNIAGTTSGFLTPKEDLDGDGILDLSEDVNGDGILEPTEDLDGDGLLQPSEDINGNGKLDLSEDLNRNGVLDIGEDANGNGRLDVGEDLNNNGVLDRHEDRNRNGVLDLSEDTNGNFILDLGEDTNGNGVLDLGEDLNGNGVLDPSEDANGNGVLDPAQAYNGAGTLVYDFYREVVVPQPGELVGRIKIADNNSPVPRDRFIFDYTFFDNVGLRPSGTDVQRFAPGFEKTFLGGIASVDVRIPFSTTIASSIDTSSSIDTTGTLAGLTNNDRLELGNVSVAGKVLLGRDDFWALSTGAQVTLPTANDVRLNDLTNGRSTELLRIENESVHVMPFLALLNTPNEKLFLQYYAQYDHDPNGNTIRANGNVVGKQKDVDFLYLDFSAGYWMYRNQPEVQTTRHGNRVNTAVAASRGITGFAPRFELHYNRALQRDNPMTIPTQAGNVRLAGADDLETLNLNLGATMMFGSDRELTVAWGTPLLDKSDSDFDNEVRVYFNWLLPK